ncbi:MAG TPA: 4'-phosphopantetheinyl transferase superfamily protein [Burkholderiaceae bacterium]|nr:4'-phosphopantetheinyl transferase superfamily protein [Burkholderiaceae bacterium]
MCSTAPLEPGCLAVHLLRRGPGPRRRPAGSGRADPRVQTLLAAHAGQHYNLSHSGDWLYLAVSACPVGVDLERRAGRHHGAAFRRYLMEREDTRATREPAEPGSAAEQALAVRIWSRLESLTKCQGQGLSGSLDGLRVPAGPLTRPWAVETAQGRHWLVDLPSPPGMVACLATPSRPRQIRLHAPDEASAQALFPPTALMNFKGEDDAS